jgi:glycosyltransferase involved in cell wall biosynthesis
VGRLDFYQKGIDILLKAFSRNRDLGIKLLLVGSGDASRLERMVRRNGLEALVEHRPRIEHDRLPEIYAAAYFLCLPSRYEGWPLVCLESYSLGKPVLGTDIPGLRDVLLDGKTGVKVPPNDATAYAGAMRKLLTDFSLRKKLGTAARRFSSDYAWPVLAKKQLQFYRKVAGR